MDADAASSRQAPAPTVAPFVSRAGAKLRHALDVFSVQPAGLRCADFGCNVGGFTDCLLRAGAASVIAVDTSYGTLDWKLRNDARVIVRERTNALHAEPPPVHLAPELIAIDLGWTPQRLCIPAALRWLADTPHARIITLIKPHYERSSSGGRLPRGAVLPLEEAERVTKDVIGMLPLLGVSVLGSTPSPITGSAGNPEWLAILARSPHPVVHPTNTPRTPSTPPESKP